MRGADCLGRVVHRPGREPWRSIWLDMPAERGGWSPGWMRFADLTRRPPGVRIEPSHLLLARPEALPEALSIAYDLLCEGSVGLVLLDAGGMTLPDRELRLLVNAVARSRVALVCLTEPRVDVPLADLRLNVTRLGWEIGDTLALRARVTVENGRHAVGRSVELALAVEESGPCWSAP